MEHYEKRQVEGRLRLQWELVMDPETRKALTLEQIMTVFRQTLRPEQFTREDAEVDLTNADQLLAGQNGASSCRTCQGEWCKEGLRAAYGLDDAIETNPDGTLTAAFLWWEPEREDARAETWFREVVRALEEAQENLLLFGRITSL